MTVKEFIKWTFVNDIPMDYEIFIESHGYKNAWNLESNGIKDCNSEITIELDKLEDGYY